MNSTLNKTALIIGGASGIGLATVDLFLNKGFTCIIWDIGELKNGNNFNDFIRLNKLFYFNVDIRDILSIKSAVEFLEKSRLNPNIVVQTAAILGIKNELWKCDLADWMNVININLIGCFNVLHEVIPLMLSLTFGRIVIVSSVSGKDGSIYASHYSASKAGLIAITKALSKELAPYNILVNCVTPSATKTPLLAAEPPEDVKKQIDKIYLKRAAEPKEIANLIGFLCSEQCSFSTGAIFDASGGRSTY